MKTTNIKGKQYVEVNERLKYLRSHFAGYSLRTEIVELTESRCVIMAKLFNAEGVEVANGLAYEDAGSSYINKTSYVENCETSAWGRCLGNFGIGIDESVASADEVNRAIAQQDIGKAKAEAHPVPTVMNLVRDISGSLKELDDFDESELLAKLNDHHNTTDAKLD